MQYTLNQLIEHCLPNISSTYLVFQNFFGEDYVDLQQESIEEIVKDVLSEYHVSSTRADDGKLVYDVSSECLRTIGRICVGKAYIYVWWPTVVVTNEHNKSITIQDLYAEIEINPDGTIPYECVGFKLNRATYPKEQFISNYLHSHIQNIPKGNFQKFESPCLGRGPIRDTITSLKTESDEVIWMLFCQELANYVTVESLTGGPWKRLEEIGGAKTMSWLDTYRFSNASNTAFLAVFFKEDLKNFIAYYLKHGHLTLSFKQGRFVSGMHFTDFLIDMSNAFIEFYNLYLKSTVEVRDKCYQKYLLSDVMISNGKIYSVGDSHNCTNLSHYQGKKVLTFKGKDITLNILNDNKSEVKYSTLLNPSFTLYVLNHIVKTINYRYKNEYNHKTDQETATPCQRVYYL